jgi:hypothetical protein
MIRKVYIILGIIVTFLVAGCFEYEEELVLNKDGSGTLMVHYSKLKDADVQNENLHLPDNEAEIRDEIEKKWTSKKVSLMDLNIRDREKSQDVTFTLKFRDVRDLNDLEQFADSNIEFKPGRHCRYQRVITSDSEWDGNSNSTFEQVLTSIIEETILDKIKFRFEIKMPNKIANHNADWIRDERNAIWRFTASDLVKGDLKMIVKCK